MGTVKRLWHSVISSVLELQRILTRVMSGQRKPQIKTMRSDNIFVEFAMKTDMVGRDTSPTTETKRKHLFGIENPQTKVMKQLRRRFRNFPLGFLFAVVVINKGDCHD